MGWQDGMYMCMEARASEDEAVKQLVKVTDSFGKTSFSIDGPPRLCFQEPFFQLMSED